MPALYLWTRTDAGIVDVTVVGPLTGFTLPRLRTVLAAHTHATVRLCLHNCTGIDDDGRCGLLLAHIEAAETGGAFHVVDVPPLVAHYLRDHHSSHLLDQGQPDRA